MNSFITPTAYLAVQAVFDLAVLIVMIFAAIEDAKTRIVPPKYQISFLIISVLHLAWEFFAFSHDLWNHGLSCVISGVGLFIIYIVLVLIFKTGIGGADTKVSSTMALYLGIGQTVILMIAHLAAGLIYAAYNQFILKKHVASGPLMVFILAGFVVARAVFWITTCLAL